MCSFRYFLLKPLNIRVSEKYRSVLTKLLLSTLTQQNTKYFPTRIKKTYTELSGRIYTINKAYNYLYNTVDKHPYVLNKNP